MRSLWQTFDTIFKGFRSFNAENLGSVGQRAAKLLAIKLWALKDLNPLQIESKVQEASIISRVGFALSKWPHFNSIYLVRVPFLNGIAVQIWSKFMKSF